MPTKENRGAKLAMMLAGTIAEEGMQVQHAAAHLRGGGLGEGGMEVRYPAPF